MRVTYQRSTSAYLLSSNRKEEAMPEPLHDDRDLLALLKFELAFIEDGGYGRLVKTPWRPTIPFRDSPTCLNFSRSDRPHPCRACSLMQYVPDEWKKFR